MWSVLLFIMRLWMFTFSLILSFYDNVGFKVELDGSLLTLGNNRLTQPSSADALSSQHGREMDPTTIKLLLLMKTVYYA